MSKSSARLRERRPEPDILPVAVAMLPGKHDRAAVASATGDGLRVEFCERASAAEALVVERQAVALFTRHHDVDGTSTADLISRLRARLPRMPIVVVESWPSRQATPFDACAAGASAVLRVREEQFQRRVEALVIPELHRMRRAELGERLACLVAVTVRCAVRSAIEHGDRPRAARELAESIGVPRKTLDRRLFMASAPSAEQLIGWGRLLAAAMCFENPRVSVSCVTRELRFPSRCALRNLLKRYAAMTPTQLRQAGGSDHLLAHVRAAMTRGTEGARTPEE